MKNNYYFKTFLLLLFLAVGFSSLKAQSSQATLVLYDFRWIKDASSIATADKRTAFAPDSGAVGVKETTLFMTEGLRDLSCPSAGGYIRATSWNTAGDLYWILSDLNTTNYFSLSVSSQQDYSSGGPTDFKLQYRLGSSDNPWVDVPNGQVSISAVESWTAGALKNLPLPAECAGNASLALRWLYLPLLNPTVAQAGGQGRIDNISVKGYQNTTSPTIYDTYSNIDFGVLGVDSTKTISINILAKNITGNLTATIDAPFSPQSPTITQAFGQINKAITLSFHPTTEGVFSKTFTISGGGITPKTVTVTGKTRNLTAVNDVNSDLNNVYASNGSIKIDLPMSQKVSIFDIMGRKVLEQQLQKGINTVSLPNNMIYIVKIENRVKKIVL